MNRRDTAGLIYDYVVTGRKQADIAADYDTDQWGGVSGTLMRFGFYDGTRGGYKKRFARGFHGLTVTVGMIEDYLKQWREGDDYYVEDFVEDNYDYYAKKQKVGKYAKTTTTKTTTTKTNTGRTTSSTAGRSSYGNGGYQPTYTYTPPQKSAWEIQQEQAAEAKKKRYDSVIRSYNANDWNGLIQFCNVYASNNQMDTPEMWFYYGYAFHQQDRYGQAVDAYRKYLNTYPSRENAKITRSNIAYCLVNAGRKQEALTELKYCETNGYNVENLAGRIRELEEELNKTSTKEEAKRAYDAKNYERCYQLLRPLAGFSTIGETLRASSSTLKDMFFELAYSAAETGRKKEAEGAYSAYIGYNPSDPVGYNNRAIIYREWEWYENELKDLEKAWSLNYRKNNIESRIAAAKKHIAEKEEKKKEQAKFDGDMTYLDQCFEQKKYDLVCKTGDYWEEKDWDLGWHYFRYAYALVEVGRDSDALLNYTRYLSKYPDDKAALNNRANVLERRERYKDALADLEKAYALGQRDFNIDTRMARLKQKIEDADVAAKLKKQFDADAEAAKTDFEAKDYQAVVNRLEPWFNKNYDMSFALFRYAYALTEMGRKEDSLQAYNRYLTIFTDSMAAYNNRAILWEAKGELDRALEDLEKAYELGEREHNIDARLTRLRNAKEAKKQAEERQKRWEANCAEVDRLMANRDLSLNIRFRIREILQPWVDEGKDLEKYWAPYSWAEGISGDVDSAESRFDWMLAVGEHNREVYTWRGRMYTDLWDKNQDEMDLDRALDDLTKAEEYVFVNAWVASLKERLQTKKDELAEERRLAEEERKRQEEEEFLLLMM
ncbi:MAG: tetratricopeptide repeat protein [Firmicutes bacterium]|nr:tetratricopeptide repeat protein [Bacillota bacterium]